MQIWLGLAFNNLPTNKAHSKELVKQLTGNLLIALEAVNHPANSDGLP